MDDIYVLNDLEKVKAISDPLRMEILQLLIKESLTAKQVAVLVNQSTPKVHYHVKELERQGLIKLVETVEKGGVLEKYYRAIANNFFVSQTLGDCFEGNEESLVEIVTQDIFSWRRLHTLRIDVQSLAKKMINTCLGINHGEVVGILGGTQHWDLIEPLAMEIQRVGAYPLISVNTSTLKQQIINELDPQMVDNYFLRLGETLKPVSTIIMLEHIVDPFTAKNVPQDKLDIYRFAWAKVRNDLISRKVKWAFVGYPTSAQAGAMNLGFKDMHDVFWQSIDLDYDKLQLQASKVARILTKGHKVTIKSDNGTNLEFSIEGRKPLIDDGIISDQDIKNGDIIINLPSGEVYIAPIENSATGTAFFEFGFYQGQSVEGVRLDFEQGKVVNFIAKENEEQLKQLLNSGEESRKLLGELGIGLNPNIEDSIGYQVFDTKKLGSIHLSLGENRLFGGSNKASLTLPFLMTGMDLWIDSTQLIAKGKLLV